MLVTQVYFANVQLKKLQNVLIIDSCQIDNIAGLIVLQLNKAALHGSCSQQGACW